MMPNTPPSAPPVENPSGQPQDQSGAIRSQLMQLLNQAAKIAGDNGIDFSELIMSFMKSSGGGRSAPPAPRGPAPASKPGMGLS